MQILVILKHILKLIGELNDDDDRHYPSAALSNVNLGPIQPPGTLTTGTRGL
jgi:hypothetical protein